jgi:thermolysin
VTNTKRALFALALFSSAWTGARTPALAQGNAALSVQATTTSGELRSWDAFIDQRQRTGDLRVRKTDGDPMVPSRTLERLQQFHRGVPIWGAEVVRDSERGVTMSLFGVLSPDLDLAVEPSLSAAQGRARLAALDAAGASVPGPVELVIVRVEGGEHRLAYTGTVFGDNQVYRAFVDAHTGTELARIDAIQHQTAVGTGRGVLGDTKKLSVDTSTGTYVAFDRHRPPVIQTFDMRGNLARAKAVAVTGGAALSDLAQDTDNDWTDVAVVDAHVHVSWTYDFFFKRFGRSGLDGRDGPINILTNAATQQAGVTLTGADFGQWVANAFWCAECFAGQGVMVFGNGIPPGFYFSGNGQNYSYFAGSLDIAAHELTHGVTSSTSRLIYQGESGALNEAFSDIMAASAEFFFHPAGSGPGRSDYLLGEDTVRAVTPGARDGSRSLENPGLYGQPDHYSRRYLGSEDGGGVHINSGIANHAFYLAIEGGVNRTSGLAVQGVGATNREQLERVFYRAFTSLLPANATFSTARAATIRAAQDLYGAGSAAERAVTQAWTAVGVS